MAKRPSTPPRGPSPPRNAPRRPLRSVTPGVLLTRLHPPGPPVSAQQLVAEIELPDAAERPHVLLNMVASLDGGVTVKGRSGALGNRADYELFHALRTVVDAVMVGAGTLRTERYNRIVDDPGERALRVGRGLAEEPLAVILSESLELPAEIPLLADPAARVVVLTGSRGRLSGCAAHVDYIRPARGGALDLQSAMAELRERFEVRVLLCEGGPHLNGGLFAAGLIDELMLTVSPKLIGAAAGETRLGMIAGSEFDPPLELELTSALESGSHLFLRYRVRRSG